MRAGRWADWKPRRLASLDARLPGVPRSTTAAAAAVIHVLAEQDTVEAAVISRVFAWVWGAARRVGTRLGALGDAGNR